MHRIVYVWNYRDWGGAQLYFASLVSKTAESFAVEAAMPEGSAPHIVERFRAEGAQIFFVKGQADRWSGSGLLNKLLRHYKKLWSENELYRQLVSRYDPADTAFHIDVGFWSSLLLMLRLSRQFHIFCTTHSPLDPRSGMRRAVWRIKGAIAGRRKKVHFLASNAAVKESLIPFLPGRVIDQIKIAYTGIEIHEINSARSDGSDSSEIRRRVDVSDEDFLIVVVGQFIVRKGACVLIDALPAIFEAIPNARIVWLAMRPPEDSLQELLHAATRSFPFGLVLEDDVGGRNGILQTLGAADVSLLPSLDEGLPGVLLEAMALGVPCIASKVGAVSEAVEDGKSGILVRPNDPKELARRLIEMQGNPDQRRLIASNARSVAMQKFDARNAAAVTVGEYKKHLATSERMQEPLTQQ